MAIERSTLTSMVDQIWMHLEENLADIERIAGTGLPATQVDVSLIRSSLSFIASEIHARRGDRERDDS